MLSKTQTDMIKHAWGFDSRQPGYRDRYCTQVDDPDMVHLVNEGYFKGPFGVGTVGENCGLFFLTEKAKSELTKLLQEKTNDWLVTIPKEASWENYLKEIEDVKTKDLSMYYRVRYKPKCKPGDRMFVVWNGKVRGWMKITAVVHRDGFMCQTTGRHWTEGWYIERKGDFHFVDGPAILGFRGIRSYSSAD